MIPGILILCILHIFSPIRWFVIIWVSPPIAIHFGFPWIVSDGFFVSYYTPVIHLCLRKINFRFSEGMVVLFFVAISCPISIRLRPNMHVESVGAAFAPMKKYPPGRLPAEHLICYSMLIGSYTHFRPDPTQGCSASWGRKRCAFAQGRNAK